VQVLEFAQKRNLSLKLKLGNISSHEHFDLPLSPRFVTKQEASESANSLTVISMIVVVPCAKEKSIQDVFKQLNFLEWAMYVLPVYVTFVVVETLVLVVNSRMKGPYRGLYYLKPLVNLRAIGAILGLSISVNRRWSFSRRQLYLTLSIFGFVFSDFFACKLSALLTKHSRYAQIRNFDELRASGLPILMSRDLIHYIEEEFDVHHLERDLPQIVKANLAEKMKRLLTFNDSFAYVMHEDNFNVLDRYQKSIRSKVFCTSENLTIISHLPKMFYMPFNSMYTWPLRHFVLTTHQYGLNVQWKRLFISRLERQYNMSKERVAPREATPLSFEHFNFLWFLLIFGYGIATLVFFIEMLCEGKKSSRKIMKPKDNP